METILACLLPWAQPADPQHSADKRYSRIVQTAVGVSLLLLLLRTVVTAEEPAVLKFDARSRETMSEPDKSSPAMSIPIEWNADHTAVILCDMWDRHWCQNATRRVGEMVPLMNQVIDTLRAQGVMIIHAPSGTMEHYADTPQRKRAMSAPKSDPPVPIQGWCYLEEGIEIQLPIDDSDEGCDDDPPSTPYSAWSSQHPGIHIGENDIISDSGHEIFNLFVQQDIHNVIMMGVHTNMCVLGRPFGIRQLTKLGFNVVLVRDLTDTMYNPNMPPYVSHERGTELVVEHIEMYWAPSVAAGDLIDEFQLPG